MQSTWLRGRSQLFHVLQECFRLFRSYAFVTVRRHVRWFFHLLAFHNRVELLLFRQSRVKLFLRLLSMAGHTL